MPTIQNLHGRPVSLFNAAQDAPDITPDTVCVYLDYDVFEEGSTFLDVWANFEAQMELEEIEQLIIGPWDCEMDIAANQIIPTLIKSAPHFKKLRTLFFGDFSGEESEISWILGGDVGPLLNAFSGLTYFGVRGGNDLRFKHVVGHHTLQTLVVETGGLSEDTVKDILAMDLPELTHLELWLGDKGYGFTGDIDTYLPLIIGKPYPDQSYPFPKLKHLALMNSEIADDIARAFLDAPVLNQLTSLDLSMGTMSDQGAQALVENEAIAHLSALNLSSNYIKDASLFARLESHGVQVNRGDQKDEEGYGRYVDVGE